MATRRPARESASKRVSQVKVGRSDLRMPCVSGGAPVNIDAKQTGVTEGITAHASTDVGAWRATGSKASAYERTRCAPIASKRVSQVKVGRSDLRMPCVSGGAPVNIDAKQTGVTEGITAHASTDVGAWRATGSK